METVIMSMCIFQFTTALPTRDHGNCSPKNSWRATIVHSFSSVKEKQLCPGIVYNWNAASIGGMLLCVRRMGICRLYRTCQGMEGGPDTACCCTLSLLKWLQKFQITLCRRQSFYLLCKVWHLSVCMLPSKAKSDAHRLRYFYQGFSLLQITVLTKAVQTCENLT